MPTYLDELLASARDRAVAARAAEPLAALVERAEAMPGRTGLRHALSGPGVAVIAEIKRASPSRGPLAADLDAVAQAEAYRAGGAAAISVLTEPSRFAGHLDDLAAVSALEVPTLRKDFVVDAYQVWEARAAGASAVLLIAAALDGPELDALLDACANAGVDALLEVHDEGEARRARELDVPLVGINARDLRTFDIDAHAFERLRPLLADDTITVAESGIAGADDVAAAAAAGADAVLVGEALVRAPDPTTAVALLVAAGAAPLTATPYR